MVEMLGEGKIYIIFFSNNRFVMVENFDYIFLNNLKYNLYLSNIYPNTILLKLMFI